MSALYAEFKRVENGRVARERDGRRGRELFSFLAAGLPVAFALLAYTGLHLQTVQVGYQIEKSRQRLAQLQEARQRLAARLAAATTPEKTAELARRLSLSAPRSGQVYYLGPRKEK
jgi:cell division protein FtsB